jgi:class 3 adenylate cyclase
VGRRRGSTLATVLFTDIVGSSEIAAELGDERWKVLVEAHHAIVRRALKRHGGRELDTAGDGFFAVFDRQAEAIRCAVEIVDEVRSIGIEVRAGLHVGEAELIAGKVGGVAVHTGARIGATAGPGEVMVSGVLRDLVPGSGIDFTDQGSQELKGIPDEVRTFAVRSVHGVELAGPLDPEIAAERRAAATEPTSRGRPAIFVGSIIGSAAIVVLVAISLANGDANSPHAATPTMAPIPPETLVRLDENTLAEQGRFGLSGEPIEITESAGRVWILEDRLLEWVSEDSDRDTVERVGLGSPSPCAIAPAERGVLLVDCAERRLYRVTEDKEKDPVLLHDLPSFGDSFVIVNSPRGLWILANREDPPQDRIYRLDPGTGTVLGPPKVLPGSGFDSFAMIEAGGYLWTFNFEDGAILRIAPTTFETEVIEEASEPNEIASSTESVWVSDHGTGEIIQFDLSGDVVDRVPRHGALAGAPDGVWALDLDRLFKVDERAGITKETSLRYAGAGAGGNPTVVGAGSVWIAVRPEEG